MQEKGLLELYDDEIFNSITDLQTTQNISENIFVLNDDLYIKQVDRLLSEYVIGEYKIINGPLSIKTSEATDKVELFKRIEAFLSVKLTWSEQSNFLRKKLLNKSVLLINKLNEIK